MTADPVPAELAACEQIIERGLATFVDVGQALLRIRDDKLYRGTFGTFEEYCSQRWGFTDRRARQLISAAEIGTIVPVRNEAQARALTGLSPEGANAVYDIAQGFAKVTRGADKPTAADLHDARERLSRPHAVTDPMTTEQARDVTEQLRVQRDEFLAERQNGEVLSPQDWQAQQPAAAGAPAGEVPCVVSPAGSDDDWSPADALDKPPPRPPSSRPASAPPRPASFDQDFAAAARDLQRAVNRVEQLSGDGRFASYGKRLDAKHRRGIDDAIEGLGLVLTRLRGATS